MQTNNVNSLFPVDLNKLTRDSISLSSVAPVEIITGFFETNETTHKHTNTDLLQYMDPVYNYKVAQATIGATMHFAVAATSLASSSFEDINHVRFYPTIAHDELNVSLGSLTPIQCTVSLINLEGKVVLKKDIASNQLESTISIEGIAKGLYLAVLQTENKRITQKIIVN